ncbi:MAG: hypothetical protein RIQ89_1663 [Bacteroidota bacterium]|jgi:hypothetical protein
MKEIHELIATNVKSKIKALENGAKAFENICEAMEVIVADLKIKYQHDFNIEFYKKSKYEAILTVADDTLLCTLHTNAFKIDEVLQKNMGPYFEEHPDSVFCSKIRIYNFLTDSLKLNRQQDTGLLLGRIFIDQRNRFFVEGKKQLGFKYNDIQSQEFTLETAKNILIDALTIAMNIEIFIPSMESMNQVSLQEIQDQHSNGFSVGKKLGFRFSNDSEK